MNVESIRTRRRSGFRPFALHRSDGRSYQVPHSEFSLVTQHTVVVLDKDGFPERLDPAHIVSPKDLAVKGRDPKAAR
jgi:hypothetical protein